MQSLRKRPTYNEVVNYLENEQPKIKYPDRRATFLRNSPYLSQFDGDSWIDLDEQEQDINKEKLKQLQLRELASTQGQTHQLLSARTQRYSIASSYSGAPSDGYDSAVVDFLSDIEHDQQEREETRKGVLSRGVEMFRGMLGQTEQQIARPEYLPQEGGASSSSGVVMPTGINPITLPTPMDREYWTKQSAERIKEELKKYRGSLKKKEWKNKEDLVNLLMAEFGNDTELISKV